MWTITQLIDSILIQPYRIFANPLLAVWFGTACLALICVVIGRLTGILLYNLNKKFYREQDAVLGKYHELSIMAAQSGDKETFKSVNSLAHEAFGKSFFTNAALFSATLWPLPFALGWMSERFIGLTIHAVPWVNIELNYIFVMLVCYVSLRLLCSFLLSRWQKLYNKKKNIERSYYEKKN